MDCAACVMLSGSTEGKREVRVRANRVSVVTREKKKRELNAVESVEHGIALDTMEEKERKNERKKDTNKSHLSIDGHGVFVKVCSGTTKNPLLARKLTVNYN